MGQEAENSVSQNHVNQMDDHKSEPLRLEISNEFKLIRDDPRNFIYEYTSTIRNRIDLEREMLIEQINAHSDEMLDRLNNFEQECYEKNSTQHRLLQAYLNDLSLNGTDLRLDKDADSTLMYDEFKLFELKKFLLNGKSCSFESANLDSKELFKLNINENLEQPKLGDLFRSKILQPNEAIELVDLCEFDAQMVKFKLIYRASRDGFGARDFHAKCDGLARTLTIVKAKDSQNVFGGFTQAEWSSRDEWCFDQSSFLFSLVNQDKRPIKLKIESFKCAIYNNAGLGPCFGGGCDLKIYSESNSNKSSYARLGCSFKHPNYVNGNYSFLAAEQFFSTNEIEVYQLFE